jgi:hypothetical protein
MLGGHSDSVLQLPGLKVNYDFFQLQVATSLMWTADAGPVTFLGGPRIAAIYMKRTFPSDSVLSQLTQDHFTLSPGLGGNIAFYPGEDRDLSIEAFGRLGYLPFSVDDNRWLLFGELGLTLGYRL